MKKIQAIRHSLSMKAALAILLVSALICIGMPALAAEAASVPTVSYLGPAGTYTEQAAWQLFPEDADFQPRETVADAVDDVLNGRADYAVIPQENTIGGPVYDYLDELLAHAELYVTGEVELPIRQALVAPEGTGLAAIQTVYSHKQGIIQGRDWLQIHLPRAQVVEVSSTAEGARLAAECADGTVAAVASTQAAKVYGLEVLAESIQQSDANVTRFYLVSTQPVFTEVPDRMTFFAEGPAHALPELLAALDVQGLALVSLHDRPAKTALGEYVYLVECSGGGQEAFARLAEECEAFSFRYLGSYRVTDAT